MSGPFGSQHWAYSEGFYSHKIDNSARFDTNSYISRTPSSVGNRKTYTVSTWVKFCKFPGASGQAIWGAGVSGARVMAYLYNEKLNVNRYDGSYVWSLQTAQVFRDPSAWYHIVIAIDTTDSTASDRVKIYVNGDRVTTFETTPSYPALNLDTYANNTVLHTHGASPYNSLYLNGYLSEINFIDGTALTPDSFGETKTDTWIPKKYTGSYGTNGYYLDFATRATDPLDASGNENNFSSTNVVSTDWMLDSPTNNFATLNALAQFGSPPISEGNLKVENANGSDGVFASIQPTGDKYYWEVLLSSGVQGYGVMANIGNAYSNTNTLYYTDGRIYVANSLVTSSATTATSGDIIGIEYDPTAETIKFFKNNTQIGSTYGATGDELFPFVGGTGNGSGVSVINFGQDSSFAGNKTAQGNTDANGRGDFYYSVPTGFLALCSANLPNPATSMNPAVDNSPQDHFNTLLWSGDNTTRSFTGVGFAPDFVWIKSRSASAGHNLFDTVRGASKQLRSNGDGAENTTNQFGLLTSFNSDGFTTTPGSYSGYESGDVNMSGRTYVGWNWKAGGSGVSNTDGTITSTVSANTDAGFSVVAWTGTGSAASIGHGLGATPKFYIMKRRDSSNYWWAGTTAIDGTQDFGILNDTDAFAASSLTLPTSSVFYSDGSQNTSSATYIAYCFAEVEGFSKIGKYIGNGSADGPFIYTGFRPAFVMWKPITGSENWEIVDSARDSYNSSYRSLKPNLSNAEASSAGDHIDLLSNGFKPRVAGGDWINRSGNTFFYMAFAEMPFKYANAR